MIIFNVNGINYLKIQSFVDIIGRSQQSTRRLLNDGNSVRRMKFIRDDSHILIPIVELRGYPFVNNGNQVFGKDIYHFVPYELQSDGTYKKFEGPLEEAVKRTDILSTDSDIVWRQEFCEECTYTVEKCQARRDAEALQVCQN